MEKIVLIEQAEERARARLVAAQEEARSTVRAARIGAEAHLDESRRETARQVRTHGSKHVLQAQHDSDVLAAEGAEVRRRLTQTAHHNLEGAVSAALVLLES